MNLYDQSVATYRSRLNTLSGLLAKAEAHEDGDALLGMIQYVLHPTTGAINDACYMQDVYVDPAHRGAPKSGLPRVERRVESHGTSAS